VCSRVGQNRIEVCYLRFSVTFIRKFPCISCVNCNFYFVSVWAPPAKLTFAVYLIHVTVINVWFFGKTTKLHFFMVDFIMQFFGVTFMSYILALIVTIFVESPAAKFAKFIESVLVFSSDTPNQNLSRGLSIQNGRATLSETSELIKK